MTPMKTSVLPFLILTLAACGGDAPKAGAAAAAPAPAAVDHDHGDERPIGPMTIGAYSFTLVQLGDVKPGGEAVFELDFAKDATVPSLARAWIGVEDGKGSRKVRFGKEGDHGLHAHVDVPSPLAEGSRLWIEIETDGKTERSASAWK
jgi:hypothetical protein